MRAWAYWLCILDTQNACLDDACLRPALQGLWVCCIAPLHCLRTQARVSEESPLEYACGALRGVAGQWLDCLLCLECVMLSTHFSAW